MTNLNERTTIPLFAIVIAIPALLVAVLYLAAFIHTAVNAEKVNFAQDSQIRENRMLIDQNYKEQTELLYEIKGATIRIESQIKKIGEH